MTYDKIDYWNFRSNPNNNACDSYTPKHISVIKPFVDKNQNILDYGPGIGRMIELYKDQKSINFYDISSQYKSRLEAKCSSENLTIKQYVINPSQDIVTPFNDNEFDIVFAFEVLLHSPEHEINSLLKELSRIGKKIIVVTWYDQGKTIASEVAPCWTRDYKNLLINNNLKLIHWDEESFSDGPQVFFIYSK